VSGRAVADADAVAVAAEADAADKAETGRREATTTAAKARSLVDVSGRRRYRVSTYNRRPPHAPIAAAAVLSDTAHARARNDEY